MRKYLNNTLRLILIRSIMMTVVGLSVPFILDTALFRQEAYMLMAVISKGNTILSGYLYGFRPSGHWMHVQSDSTGLYLYMLNIALLSVAGSLVYTIGLKKKELSARGIALFTVFVRYLLAFKLLQYGLNKVFKCQFFQPEPNILYTPFGMLPKELLYWSVNGISYGFSVFTGALECLAGMLLLWRRTFVPGAIAAFVILVQVAAVNFCYDISVKILSLYLLLLAGILLFPYLKSIIRFLAGAAVPPLAGIRNNAGSTRRYGILKYTVILLMLGCTLYPYVISGNYNDDRAPRPPYHGAYSPERIIMNGDTFGKDELVWKRIFVHRKQYLIVQDDQDIMQDYPFSYGAGGGLYMEDPSGARSELFFETKDSLRYTITGIWQGDSLRMDVIRDGYKQLPALQQGFHWRVDE